MGTFMGHILPGSCILLIGIWWTLAIWMRYFRSLLKSKDRSISNFRSTCTFQFPYCSRYPLEGFLKVLMSVIGIIGETIHGFKQDHILMRDIQHISMYFFYAISGIFDILLFYKFPVPLDCDYASIALGLIVEALLFNFHLHDRSMLDVRLHTLLVWVIVASIISVFMEMKFRHNVLCSLTRAVCTLIHGSWFYQIGFILYNPIQGAEPWSPNSHSQIMLATTIVTWHIAGALFFNAIVTTLIWIRFRNTICYDLYHEP